MIEKNALKWEARKNRSTPNYHEIKTKMSENGDRNPMKKEFQEYLSLQTVLCPRRMLHDKKVAARETRLADHNISMPASLDLLEEVFKLIIIRNSQMCRKKTLIAKELHSALYPTNSRISQQFYCYLIAIKNFICFSLYVCIF